jgi:hypothetical protein
LSFLYPSKKAQPWSMRHNRRTRLSINVGDAIKARSVECQQSRIRECMVTAGEAQVGGTSRGGAKLQAVWVDEHTAIWKAKRESVRSLAQRNPNTALDLPKAARKFRPPNAL